MSIFNETLPEFVQKEINGRQNNLANRNNIYTINSKTAWVRMTSGVNVLDKNGQLSNKLAKENVIFNILGGNASSGNPMVGYTTGNRHGIRPLPGINSLNCQSYAPNGSLRKVVVKFTVWDIKQLDLLEILYMRPGMTVCIEWGWSHKLADNKTNLLPNFGTKFLEDADASLLSLHKRAYEEIISNGGNFDICIGKVQNYSYSARMDGGFDCETTIVSYNEILESFKVNFIPLNMESPNENTTTPLVTANSITYTSDSDDNLQSKYAEGIIPGILYELYQRGLADDQGGSGTIRNHNYKAPNSDEIITYSLFSLKLPPAVINKQTDPNVIAQNATSIFIKFGDFINILNNFVLYNNKSGTITSVSLTDEKGNPLKCVAHPFQFSTNPAVCIISADGWINANEQIKSDLNEVKDETTNPTPGATPPATSYKGNIVKLNQLISEIPDSSASTSTFLSLVEDELKNGATSLGQAINNVWEHIADLNPTPINENGKITYEFNNGVWTYTTTDGKSVQLNKFLNLTNGSVNTMVDIIVLTIEGVYNQELKQRDNKYSKIIGSLGIGIFEANNFERNRFGSNYHLKDTAIKRIKTQFESSIVNKIYYFNEATTEQFTEVTSQEIGKTLGATLSNLSYYSFFDDTRANSDYKVGRIENIFINLDFIYKLVKPSTTVVDDKNKKNEISFNQLINNILLEVQNSIGSINQFEIYGDGIETGKTYIIDKNYIDPVAYKDLFSFQLDNTSSTAKNYSIRSQIFPEQSSIIAISTQAQSGKLGTNNKGLVNYNYGIKDRVIGTADSGAELATTLKQQSAQFPKTHINQALSTIATAVTQLYIVPAAGVTPPFGPPI